MMSHNLWHPRHPLRDNVTKPSWVNEDPSPYIKLIFFQHNVFVWDKD